MTGTVRLSLAEADTLVYAALTVHGISEDQARAITDTVVMTERDGCPSHGMFRVPGYILSALRGRTTPDAVPVVHNLAPGVVQVDAANGYSPLALKAGRGPLAEKARKQGIAALSIVNAYHFAALWPEVEPLAEEGLVAFAFVNGQADVAPPGGIRPLFGTDPMAFAWPRRNGPPVVFDQSSAARSRGDIMLHERDGKPIPPGVAIDKDGNPTTDPTAGLAGAQLPFGGYKGGNLALMVELLAGALAGGLFSYESSAVQPEEWGPCIGSEFMIAIDPAKCGGGSAEAVLDHGEALFAKVLEQEGTRLPAQRRHRARATAEKQGIEIPKDLHARIAALARGETDLEDDA
ncbi:MAG: Ldh family oxidoreductase [Rhodospirillaceae bacterium]|jgi:delta1-piperideine-2-carboxylate reductase|nr:Ldh family oxidoreductase [Rhodospirillaceae bacterium]